MAYPTAGELVEASSVDELTALSAEDQEALRLSAIGAVEAECGQSFDSFEGALLVPSQGSNVLYLPRRIESVIAVSLADVPWTLSDIALAEAGDRLALVRYAGNYYEQAMRDVQGLGFAEPLWPRGDVVVEGLWGWSECPPRVVTALRYDMEDTARADANALAPSITALRKLGLAGISQGNLTTTIAGPGGQLSMRARRLVDVSELKWFGAGGMLA